MESYLQAVARRTLYMGRSEAEANVVAEAFGDYLGIPRFVFDGAVVARTNAVPDAPVASGTERFPVVLLTPGGGAGRTLNTAWAEELASHGYVVAALDHPCDSTAVVFADGRTVRRPEHSFSSDAEARRLVEELAAVKAADLSSALTYLGRLDSGEAESILAGRLDTDRAASSACRPAKAARSKPPAPMSASPRWSPSTAIHTTPIPGHMTSQRWR